VSGLPQYGRANTRPQEGDVVRYATAMTDWRVFAVGNYTDGPFWVSLQQIGGRFRKRYMVPAVRLRLVRRAGRVAVP
jgi:hypothetical protein